MTDQVNPLGSLVPAVAQTLQAAASIPSKPPSKPAESKASSQEKRDVVVSKETLESAAKDVQEYLDQAPTDIKFMVDQDTGTQYFKIINPITKEVILQVPPDEILTMARKLRALGKKHGSSGVRVSREG